VYSIRGIVDHRSTLSTFWQLRWKVLYN